jgi:phthalate 4,5-cis-dihydrodiol dehydrogenase
VIRAGILGLGLAGGTILRSLSRIDGVAVVAAADLRDPARAEFEREYGGTAYRTAEDLCADHDAEAIWIATPSHLHAQHAALVAGHGKHAVVEKPFATSISECDVMIEAAARSGTALIAGGARSFDPAFAAMRRVIATGQVGEVRAISTWAFTDWMIRPREPYELDASLGGGAIYNQAPHAVDVIRLLGGGLVRSVRALAGGWMAERPGAGYFSALLEFESGVAATMTYNGYGYLAGWELLPWGETDARRGAQEVSRSYRRALRAGLPDEAAPREARRFGGDLPRPDAGPGWVPGDAGIVVASCERGEIRQSRDGLYVYDDAGRHDQPLAAGVSFRGNEVAELLDAIEHQRAPLHSGPWGRATTEVCLAIAQSAAQRREVLLEYQVPAAALSEEVTGQ